MGDLLQLFAHGYSKWLASGRRWEVGEWQAPKISACIWQVSKCWTISLSKQGQIKYIKLRKLKLSDGKFITIICTWMRPVGGKWWILRGSWVIAPEISGCKWQASITLYQQQGEAKSSRLNCDN